jgi:hypothetical protein
VRLQIAASPAYANGKEVPIKSALLMTDTVNFYGKSGMVKLAKGLTTMYVVLSTEEIPCEMNDVYDRQRVLRANKPRLSPKLPKVEKDEDFTAMFFFQQGFDHRKVSNPPLIGAINGELRLQDFKFIIPGGWHRQPKEEGAISVAPAEIHFTGGFFELMHPSSSAKGYQIERDYLRGSWAYEMTGPAHALYFDIRKHDPPFDPSMLTLVKLESGWGARFDLSGSGFKITTDVPIRVCPANSVSLD